MDNVIISIILVAIVGTALFYIITEKKKGNKCIGCPAGGCNNCTSCMNGTSSNEKSE